MNNKPNGKFDRKKGIALIEKHKSKDIVLAMINSPSNKSFILYENADNELIYNVLCEINVYLSCKEIINENTQDGDAND